MRKLIPLLLVLFAAPLLFAKEEEKPKARAKAKPAEVKADPTTRFWEARRVMLKGDPQSAAELFRTIVSESPTAAVADDCLYWMGRCYLRVDDREPDAVVAFKRLIGERPESPFVDDAARELFRLGDSSIAPLLRKRLANGGEAAEMAARALAELGSEDGIRWLEVHLGEKRERSGKAKKVGKTDPRDREIAELREEVRRLRTELDECLKLLRELKAKKEAKDR